MKKIVNTILATGIVAAAIARVTTFPAQAQNECRLTFSGYEGTETLRDFPALIKIPDGLTGFDYKEATVDGSDLAFFGTDGKPLACEIDTWDPEGDSYVWVRVPEVTKATTITARWGEQRARCPLSQSGTSTISRCGTSRRSGTA